METKSKRTFPCPSYGSCFSQTKATKPPIDICSGTGYQPSRWSHCFPSTINQTINSVLFLQTGFPCKPTTKGTKGAASWEACIVNLFPRCLICAFGTENYSHVGPLPNFPLADSNSFTTLNTWGQGSFLIAGWRQSFFFAQFGPVVLIFQDIKYSLLFDKSWGWRIQFSKAVLTLPLVIQWVFQPDWL